MSQAEQRGVLPSITPPNNFVGRKDATAFFVENILAVPTKKILAISSNGGVGKTTLLAQFIALAHSPEYNERNVTALVDERWLSPVNVLESFASQFSQKGYQFKKFEEEHQHVKEILRLDDPLQDLTMTFLDDLHDIIHPHSSLFHTHPKPIRQIVLFFDRFGRLAPTLSPWLLNYLLPNIDEHVVLVLAGRAPIEVSIPNGYVSWQKYHDDQTLHCIALDNFTEEETQEYLKLQGITDPTQCRSIWEVSHGLPFYLSLLTSHAHTDIDPNESVVANLLSRIPEKEQVQRTLALDAALLTRPFNQDDLKSFPCLNGQDSPTACSKRIHRLSRTLLVQLRSTPNIRGPMHSVLSPIAIATSMSRLLAILTKLSSSILPMPGPTAKEAKPIACARSMSKLWATLHRPSTFIRKILGPMRNVALCISG